MQIRSASNTSEVNWDDPLNKGLVAWMPMGQNGRPVTDLVSGGVGVPSGGPSAGLNNATRKWGVDLDGVDDYITIPHHPVQNTITDQVTFSWWSRINDGDVGGVISKYNLASNRSWAIKVSATAGFAQKVELYISNDGLGVESEIFSEYSLLDEWQHHVLSWNAGVGRILYNGDLTNIGTATHTADTSIFAGTADLVIGARYNTNELLDGQISDIRIYNRALSDAEMRQVYEASLNNYPDQYKRRYFPVSLQTEEPPTETTSTGLIRLKSPKQTQPSYKAGYAKSAAESAKPNLWKGLVGAWAPNLGITGDMLRDVSGNGNHGTLTNMDAATDWVATSKGLALDFDGVDDHVEVGTNEPLEGKYENTFGGWVRFSSGSSFVGTIIGKSGYGGNPSAWTLQWHNGTVVFSGRRWSNTTNYYFGSVNSNWYHFLVRTDRVSQSLYVNGNLEFSDNITGVGAVLDHSQSLQIGKQDVTSFERPWKGEIGFTSVYDRALSPNEIKQLYVDSLAPFRQRRYAPVSLVVDGALAYTLTAETGAFTLTGNDATLTKASAYSLAANTGSFVLTGSDAGISGDRVLVAATGDITVIGSNAVLTKASASTLAAGAGSFTLTGNDATLTKVGSYSIEADTGSFALAGSDTSLKSDSVVEAGTATYTLTGNSAGLVYSQADPVLPAAKGAFTVSAGYAQMVVSRKAQAETGEFNVNGNDTQFRASRKFAASVTDFALDATQINLEVARRVATSTGAFLLDGVDARLRYSEEGVTSLIKNTSASISVSRASATLQVPDSRTSIVVP